MENVTKRSEASIKRSISAMLKYFTPNDNYHHWMPAGTMFSTSLPDYMCLIKGKLLCIEAKSTIGKLTTMQDVVRGKLERAGAEYWVVNNKEAIEVVRLRIIELLRG